MVAGGWVVGRANAMMPRVSGAVDAATELKIAGLTVLLQVAEQ